MSPVVARYHGVGCAACGRTFDTVGAFEGHAADGEPCPGGRVG